MFRKKLFALFCLSFLLIISLSNLGLNLGFKMPEGKADSSTSSGWFYTGWQYRKEHNITYSEMSSTLYFYDLSEPWITISGNPTNRHTFQPVHNTTIVEVNKIIDGSLQRYLAYDSDSAGSEIRLYYTNDTDGYWTPYSKNPILGPSAYHYRWPSVAYVNGIFHMFLTDRTDGTLERWTSIDGIHYNFEENIKVGGNQWKTPFIWFNLNDNKWYLYTHDATGSTEHVKVRSATSIENLASAADTIVISVAAPFGGASVMYSNNSYWLAAEILEQGTWKIRVYYSTASPFSGFSLAANSPILADDEACPVLLLSQDQTQAYLFTNSGSSTWYQLTRKVYLNSTIFPETPALTNYQVRIRAYYGSGVDAGENVYLGAHSRADFGDVRFTWFNFSSGLEQECPYYIEELETGENALFWVKIPEIFSVRNNTIYIYYGKADATTTANAQNTFDLFDDFNGDLSGWTVIHYDGTGSASIVNGWARISAQPNGDYWGTVDSASGIFKTTPLSDNYVIETIVRQQSYPTSDAHNRFLMSRANTGNNAAFYVVLFDDDSSHITTNWRDSNGAYTGWAGENTGWSRGSQTTLHARLAKIGSTFYAYISPDGNTWFSVGSRSGNYHGYIGLVDSYHDGYTEFDWIRLRKYAPEPNHGGWGSEEEAGAAPTPSISVSDISVNSTIAAKPCNFSAIFTAENSYLSHYIFGTNNTGVWINDTAVSFGGGKTQALASIVKTLNSTIGTVVQWCIWANNTAGNWTSTGIQSILVHDGEYVIIDKAVVSDDRADVGSIQTVSFHAKWSNNGSNVVGGSIYVNGTEYVTNSTGWINIEATARTEKVEWIVTGVNCSGITTYTQTAQIPSIIWDRIKIIDGGITKGSVMLEETVTVWFKALYEYDNDIFDVTNGVLYVNGSQMSWSAINNRWEYQYTPTTPGTKTFTISEAQDNSYGLTTINDMAGAQTINVWSSPLSIISSSNITELAFNSTSKTITFTVTGPTGTIGYTNITIAKTLIENITDLVIYLDGNQIEYTATSTEYTWLIHFTYTHSTHKVLITLSQTNANPINTHSHGTIITLSSIAILLLAPILTAYRKVRRK